MATRSCTYYGLCQHLVAGHQFPGHCHCKSHLSCAMVYSGGKERAAEELGRSVRALLSNDIVAETTGWAWQSLAIFIEHKGSCHNISGIGPSMLGSLLRSVWATRMARTASTKRGLETRNQRRVEREEEPVATGIPTTQNEAGSTGEDLGQQVSTCTAAIPLDLHHVKLLLHSKQGGEPLLNPLQASCLHNFVVGGVWTQTRLHLAGYEVDTTCALC